MEVTERFTMGIQKISDSFISGNIYYVSNSLLAKALMNIDQQCQDKILRNMSTDSAEAVKKMMADLEGISKEEIESAQREIISMADGYI